MIPYTYRATVARLVDADTLDLDADLGFHVTTRIRVRLARVDAPERGTPGHPAALAEVQRVAPPGASVTVATARGDRYGRWIGEVVNAAGVNVSDALLAAGLAVPYQPTTTTAGA